MEEEARRKLARCASTYLIFSITICVPNISTVHDEN